MGVWPERNFGIQTASRDNQHLAFHLQDSSADPQTEQKRLLCLVEGRMNDVFLSSPATHLRLATEENRFAA